jgi:hypothetical protein
MKKRKEKRRQPPKRRKKHIPPTEPEIMFSSFFLINYSVDMQA